MKRILASALPLLVLAVVAARLLAQDKASPAKPMAAKPMHVMENEADLKWMDAPPVFPAGAKMAVLQGDPGKAGLFTLRLRVPDGYKVASHWHPTAENITVISGTFNLGTGDVADPAKTTALTAGGFGTMPAHMHHYAWTKGETEVQVHAQGPFKLIYVNPKDDPTAAKK